MSLENTKAILTEERSLSKLLNAYSNLIKFLYIFSVCDVTILEVNSKSDSIGKVLHLRSLATRYTTVKGKEDLP